METSPDEKFENIQLTVISVQGLRPNMCTALSKVHVEIQAGEQVHKTAGARGMAPHAWNEKFKLRPTGSEDLSLSLYRTRPFRQPAMIGKLTISPDLEPRNQDLVKTFPSSSKRRPTTVTFRLQDRERNMRDPRCPVFAFIIGIDEYLSNTIPDLRGCVNDAHTIRTFLSNRFRIPEPQIAFLANEDATRAAILDKFQTHLIDNSSIERGDTIIIYYAGHGSRAPAPESWPSADGKIETLVPHDERMKTAEGEDIHGIPDRTINLLLSRLASEKGNNITVIFDCCHSGGLTRGAGANVLSVPRFIETTLPIPANLDQGLFGTASRSGSVSLPPDARHKSMDSHVLLAACRQQQRAQECLSVAGAPCGFFTDSLVKQLRAVGPNRITYAELLDLLPTLPDQHPQCEGANKDRFVFAVEGPVRDPRSCALSVREDGMLEIDMGSLHGVVVGTQFVPQRAVRTQELQRVLVAVAVALDSAIVLPLTPVADVVFPEGTRLVVSDWKNDAARMKVYVNTSDSPRLALSDAAVARLRPNYLLVESLDAADLAVTRVSEEVFALTRLDAKLARYIAQDVQLTAPLASLPSVLDAVGHFNHFLALHNTRAQLGDGVQLEMYNLRGNYGAREPDPDVGNLVVANEARFRFDRRAKYGFAICNYSAHDLFPYVFYFDPATYSIDAWYVPASSTMPAPLPAMKGTEPTRITVGYGASGDYAFQFVLPEGILSDTGFLKLFYSTKYLDLKRIEQPEQPAVVDGARDSQGACRPAMDADIWGALDVAVTMFVDEEEPQQERLFLSL